MGSSDSELKNYGFKSSDLSKYLYINQGGVNSQNNNDDKQNYRLVNDAMRIANFQPALIKTVWSIVAAIIHLGNVGFISKETDQNNNSGASDKFDQVEIERKSLEAVKLISKLIEVDEDELKKVLTSRQFATGNGEIVTKLHSNKDALYAKDAFAKAMYEHLFTFIFSRVNEILDIKHTIQAGYGSKNTVIGVLDIYGFEVFEVNG